MLKLLPDNVEAHTMTSAGHICRFSFRNVQKCSRAQRPHISLTILITEVWEQVARTFHTLSVNTVRLKRELQKMC